MQDVIYIAVMVAFFLVCVAYVRGLDHLVDASEADEKAADLVDPNLGDPEALDSVVSGSSSISSTASGSTATPRIAGAQ